MVLLLSYVLLGSSGLLVFISTPSSSLVDQGGWIIVYTWGTFCLVGGIGGVLGLIFRRRPIEVLGAALGVTASLTWCASLVLQAVSIGSAVPLTAACMTASLASMFAHRCCGGSVAAHVAAQDRKGRTRWWWSRRRTP